ncbi:hypothetical protein GCM10027589_20300 [Actinocorallia lasiicapitis]
MGVQEKVAQEEFSFVTTKSPEEIKAAGRKAVESGKRFLTNTVREGRVTESSVHYAVSGPGGLVEQMKIRLSWRSEGEGKWRVSLEVPDYLTVRETYMFIPLSPRRAPALGSLRRFSASLRAELGR